MSPHASGNPVAQLSTRSFGQFSIEVRTASRSQGNDILLYKGEPTPGESVLCRVTTACTLSTAFDASDCDCRDQLRVAMALISAEGRGAVIYLDQEGRGHGIQTKIRALRNKNNGLDTIAAVEDLGLESDVTDYRDVPAYLRAITTGSVRLLTNNPAKVQSLTQLGVEIAGVVSCRAFQASCTPIRAGISKPSAIAATFCRGSSAMVLSDTDVLAKVDGGEIRIAYTFAVENGGAVKEFDPPRRADKGPGRTVFRTRLVRSRLALTLGALVKPVSHARWVRWSQRFAGHSGIVDLRRCADGWALLPGQSAIVFTNERLELGSSLSAFIVGRVSNYNNGLVVTTGLCQAS